jgi:methylated-DNA-[protein]-cysteine S-methyltransferase
MTYHAIMASPLGDILLCADAASLSGLYFAGQSDCPPVPGPPRHRARASRPSDGTLAGQEIRNFKAYRADVDDLFAPAPAHLPPLSAQPGASDAARPRLLQDDTPPEAVGLFQSVQKQLAEYFAGHRTVFDVPISLQGTEFQKKVWLALLAIPYGTVVSYGDVARSAGLTPRHGRPVGTAVGRNPVSIIIPCHRVVSGTRALTGYTGGLERKLALLELEGFKLY